MTLTATVPLGASVRWLYEHVITIGQAVTIDLHQGGNLVNITVTQSGHRSSNYAYRVITREAMSPNGPVGCLPLLAGVGLNGRRS